MLKWFADRLARSGEEVRKDERGFTLIELLVVVIIIGILAAVAIPTFLSQREGAQDAAAESDLRNAASAQEAYFAENDEYFYGDAVAENLPSFNSSENVTITSADNGDGGFELTATSAADNTFVFDSADGTVQPQGG